MTSEGTILGLSPNFGIWIGDDGRPSKAGMPDNDNDEIRGSAKVRDSSKRLQKAVQGPRGEVCPQGDSSCNSLESLHLQTATFSLDRGEYGMSPFPLFPDSLGAMK